MKKRSIIISVCAALVIIALTASLIFVFGGKNENPKDSNEKGFSLVGTWVVVANYTKDSPVFVDNQFMIFSEEKAIVYKDNNETPFAESKYEIDTSNKIILSDISREYKLAPKTDNCIRLYDTADTYMLLVRNADSKTKLTAISGDLLQGKWDIKLKAETFNNGEVMSFKGTSLAYYKDSSGKPTATAEFSVENNVLNVESLGLKMKCYKTGEDNIVFVEESGIIWEVAKAK